LAGNNLYCLVTEAAGRE